MRRRGRCPPARSPARPGPGTRWERPGARATPVPAAPLRPRSEGSEGSEAHRAGRWSAGEERPSYRAPRPAVQAPALGGRSVLVVGARGRQAPLGSHLLEIEAVPAARVVPDLIETRVVEPAVLHDVPDGLRVADVL